MLQDIWADIVDQVSWAWRAETIAIISAAVAILGLAHQVYTSRAKLKRKKPVLEVSKSIQAMRMTHSGDPPESPAYVKFDKSFLTDLLIRNVEPSCGIRLKGVQGRRGARFANFADLATVDEYGRLSILRAEVSEGDLKRSIPLDRDLSPSLDLGATKRQRADVARVTLLSQRPISAGEVTLMWHWADEKSRHRTA